MKHFVVSTVSSISTNGFGRVSTKCDQTAITQGNVHVLVLLVNPAILLFLSSIHHEIKDKEERNKGGENK